MKKHKITKKKYDSRVYKNWVNSLETWSFHSKYLFDLVRSMCGYVTRQVFQALWGDQHLKR